MDVYMQKKKKKFLDTDPTTIHNYQSFTLAYFIEIKYSSRLFWIPTVIHNLVGTCWFSATLKSLALLTHLRLIM